MTLLFRLPEKVGSKIASYLDVPSFLNLLEVEDSHGWNEKVAFRWSELYDKFAATTPRFWTKACYQLLPRSLFEKELERYHSYDFRSNTSGCTNDSGRVRLCTMRTRLDDEFDPSSVNWKQFEDSCSEIFYNSFKLNRQFVCEDERRFEIATRSRNLKDECMCVRASMLRKRYSRVRFVSGDLMLVLRDFREIWIVNLQGEQARIELQLILPENMQKRCFITDFVFWNVRYAESDYLIVFASTTFGLWHSFYVRKPETHRAATNGLSTGDSGYQLVGSHFDMLYKAPYASIHRMKINSDRLVVHSSHVLDACSVEIELKASDSSSDCAEFRAPNIASTTPTDTQPLAAIVQRQPSQSTQSTKGPMASARIEVQHRFVTQQDARVAAVDSCGDVVVWFDLLQDLPAHGNFALLLDPHQRRFGRRKEEQEVAKEKLASTNGQSESRWYHNLVHTSAPSSIPASSKLQNDHVIAMLACATNSRRRNCAQQAQAILASPHDDAPEHWLQRRIPQVGSSASSNQPIIGLIYLDPYIIYLSASGEMGIAELPSCRVIVSYDFWSAKRRVPEILTQYANMFAITMQYGEVWFYALPLSTFSTASSKDNMTAPRNGDASPTSKAGTSGTTSTEVQEGQSVQQSNKAADGPQFDVDRFSFESPLFVLPPDSCSHGRERESSSNRIITPESSTVLCIDMCWDSTKGCLIVALGSEVNLRVFECYRQNRRKRKTKMEAELDEVNCAAKRSGPNS